MPELPEVETIRAGLQRLLPGRIIDSIDFDWEKSFPNNTMAVEEYALKAKVTQVTRQGKVLLIELSTHYTFIIHLKMTGQLVFVPAPHSNVERQNSKFAGGHPNDSLIHVLPDKSTHVTITFTDGSKLFFNDQRKFGWVRLFPTAEIPNIDFFKTLGPDALSKDFTGAILFERLQSRKNTSIKAALLDQTVVAGIGNIYADESLWAAKIHPATTVKVLSWKQVTELYKVIIFILQLSLKKGGSTDKNYVDAEGNKGSFLQFAQVFRREGQKCPRCGSIIEKIRVAGRGTHICPTCQKIEDTE